MQILENAFINALQPAIDQQIDLATVDQVQEEEIGILQKVFGDKGKDNDHSKDDKAKRDKKKDRKGKEKDRG